MAWDPTQYARFAAERSEPFRDLCDLIDPGRPGEVRRVVDLGCGSGELTLELAERLPGAEVLGIDNSDAMLERARALADERLRFEHGDIAGWTSTGDHDLVLANASLQWVPDHPTVIGRWFEALAPGGQLAVQVPANADHASHLASTAVAEREPFRSALGGDPPADPVAANVLAPERYAELLHNLGAERQHVRLQVYPHVLGSTDDVVEWTKGTSLTRVWRILPAELHEPFVDAYRDELIDRLGRSAPFFYTFKRILIWARRPGGRRG